MSCLADTNILLRFTNILDPHHAIVTAAVRCHFVDGETLNYTPQNRREFWNVCTRPVAGNGLGYTVAETLQRLTEVDAIFHRLPYLPESDREWDRLVAAYQVTGRAVHDAQLVASMVAYGIARILSLNVGDFRRYVEATAVDPRDVKPAADRTDP